MTHGMIAGFLVMFFSLSACASDEKELRKAAYERDVERVEELLKKGVENWTPLTGQEK